MPRELLLGALPATWQLRRRCSSALADFSVLAQAPKSLAWLLLHPGTPAWLPGASSPEAMALGLPRASIHLSCSSASTVQVQYLYYYKYKYGAKECFCKEALLCRVDYTVLFT